MQRMKQGIFKSITCIFLALILVVLSLCDCLGRAGSFLVREERTEAVAIVDDIAVGSALFSILVSLGFTVETWDKLQTIQDDMEKQGAFTSEDWAVTKGAKSMAISAAMVSDVQVYLGAKSLADSGMRKEIPIGNFIDAYSYLIQADPDAAAAISSAGLASKLAGLKRFGYQSREDIGEYGSDILSFPDTIKAFIFDDDGYGKVVMSDGSLVDLASVASSSAGSRIFGTLQNFTCPAYKKNGVISYSTAYEQMFFLFNCRVGYDSKSEFYYLAQYSSSGTLYCRYHLVGFPVYLSATDYVTGKEPTASDLEYGYGLGVSGLIIDAALQGSIVGKEVFVDRLAIEKAMADICAAAQAGYDASKANNEDEEAANAAGIAAATAAATASIEALLNEKLGDSDNGIIGLLKSILAALTSGGLFALLKSLFETISDYISDIRNGSIFKSIIDAITAVPGNIINAITSLPDNIADAIKTVLTDLGLVGIADAIGSVMKTVLEDLGLDEVFGRAIDGALDWVKGIPGALADAVSGALDWIMDIPKGIADAIQKGLEWVMDIPQGIADAISKGLEWIMDIPQDLADAISDALDWLRDLTLHIPGLSDILGWLILDIPAVQVALAALRELVLEKISIPFKNPFANYSKELSVIYPVIHFTVPKVLKAFYSGNEIILIDFSDYAQYCHTTRTLLQGILWFSYALYLIKSTKIYFTVG